MPTGFSTPNPDYREAVRESFGRQALMATLGATLERVEAGEVEIALARSPQLTQQHGFLHAGVVAAIADSANGYAAFTLAPPDHDVLAVEFKINLLRPARAPRLVAHGRVLRPGRTLTVCLAEVHGEEDGERELVATMLSTIAVRSPAELP